MSEFWKPVPNFPKYEASSLGRVRGPRGIMRGARNSTGYLYCFITVAPKHQKGIPLHRMVAFAFLTPVDGKNVVNHLNGIKTDNRPENLEWCTLSENTAHSLHVLGNKSHYGSSHKGEETPNSVLTEDIVRSMRQRASEGAKTRAIAEEFGFERGTVYAAINRINWKHVA